MASGKTGKVSTIRVGVCGLTSSSFNGLHGQGAGKSCLCNRFIQVTQDRFNKEHTSVLNLSEFGSNVINNTHFLYWGEKLAALEDGQDIKFQVQQFLCICLAGVLYNHFMVNVNTCIYKSCSFISDNLLMYFLDLLHICIHFPQAMI